MKISAVTTFNAAGYEKYGKRFLQTYIDNWPKTVHLFVYAENCQVAESASNITVVDMNTACTKLLEFKNKWRHEPKANGDISKVPRLASRKDSHKPFKWDAVRFSHKVYSIFHCASSLSDGWLLWMDADTVCHSPITQEQVESFLPSQYELCFLGREKKFSECGLYGLNLETASARKFLQQFQEMYDNAEQGIFTLEEWHDSYVFDEVRKRIVMKELNWSKGLVKGEGHPLINSAWGAFLDHLKGDRKDIGRSKTKDLLVARKEKYWR